VIPDPWHTVWLAVAAAELSVMDALGLIVIVPVAEAVQLLLPVVVTVYVPVVVGIPLMVTVLPVTLLNKPPGKLVTFAPVPLPPIVKVMLVIAMPEHTDWLLVPAPELNVSVAAGFTVIVPERLAVEQPPVVVTV